MTKKFSPKDQYSYYSSSFNEEFYERRTIRNQFWFGGKKGQNIIRNLCIGVAGLGGMGSNIAETLIRHGVGHLKIADNDTIEITNINRQVIANKNTLGKLKTEASVAELRSIAEDFELEVYNKGVNKESISSFIDGCDAVIDEIDVFSLEAHILLHEECRKKNIPVYSAFTIGLGIHFYKFQGSDFTFEKFLNFTDEQIKNPTADLLISRFLNPTPSYLDKKFITKFKSEINDGNVPILGTACLLGHSIVCLRVLLDLLQNSNYPELFKFKEATPLMPEFLIIDPVNFSLTKETYHEST
jgi:molybdopterin/thiamine biosynthesis adenylyltransferase